MPLHAPEVWHFTPKGWFSVKIRFERIAKRQETILCPQLSQKLRRSSITSCSFCWPIKVSSSRTHLSPGCCPRIRRGAGLQSPHGPPTAGGAGASCQRLGQKRRLHGRSGQHQTGVRTTLSLPDLNLLYNGFISGKKHPSKCWRMSSNCQTSETRNGTSDTTCQPSGWHFIFPLLFRLDSGFAHATHTCEAYDRLEN